MKNYAPFILYLQVTYGPSYCNISFTWFNALYDIKLFNNPVHSFEMMKSTETGCKMMNNFILAGMINVVYALSVFQKIQSFQNIVTQYVL